MKNPVPCPDARVTLLSVTPLSIRSIVESTTASNRVTSLSASLTSAATWSRFTMRETWMAAIGRAALHLRLHNHRLPPAVGTEDEEVGEDDAEENVEDSN
ncbi:hypothetical protein E8E14_008696 [Neopestalotiopsis sp. 37M]|nr:hypothetical protein E8E14_008696 [Neopestalotiopsis sp. 37M]